VPVSRNQPSPQRQSVLTFATADVADFLFYETVDAQRFGKSKEDLEVTIPKYGTPHPDPNKFPNHKLCHVKASDPNGLSYQFFYVADRSAQENNHNWEYKQADLGGNKYDTVVRTYVTLRSEFTDTDSNQTAGTTMPNSEGGVTDSIPNWNTDDVTGANQFNAENVLTHDTTFEGVPSVDEKDESIGYILYTRQQQKIGDQELDGLFVVEQRTYFRRVDIVTQQLDPTTAGGTKEGVLKRVVKLVYRGESFKTADGTSRDAGTAAWMTSSNWGLTDNGQNLNCEQLSHDWWQVTIQDVIPQGLGDKHGGKLVRSYSTFKNYSWPAVVGSLHFRTANKRDGSTATTVTVRNKDGKDAFSGPTRMTIDQVWRKAQFTLDGSDATLTPKILKTVSAKYSGVQFSVAVSNVLTEAITLTDFIGTGDPVYKLGDYAFPKPFCKASDPTDWPSSFVGSVSQKPFRGGYLLEVVTVHSPS